MNVCHLTYVAILTKKKNHCLTGSSEGDKLVIVDF